MMRRLNRRSGAMCGFVSYICRCRVQDSKGTTAPVLQCQRLLPVRLCSLLPLDRSAARLCTAGAGCAVRVGRKIVVDRQFLAWFDLAKAHVKNVALHNPADEVRLAAMIDDLGAAASGGSVDGPIGIYFEQVSVLSFASPFGLPAADALAGVFNHLPVGGDVLGRVHSVTVDFGSADFECEASMVRIDAGRFYKNSSHVRFGCLHCSGHTHAPRAFLGEDSEP